jgi:mannosyltransferase
VSVLVGRSHSVWKESIRTSPVLSRGDRRKPGELHPFQWGAVSGKLSAEMKRHEQQQARLASPIEYLAALLAISLAGLVLRIYGLGSESLWWDEVYAISTMAQPGPLEIIRLSSTDNNPPLFYLILHYWMLFAGDSAFSVRLPSAIAGALAIPVMYGIGRLLFDRGAGLLAAFILALSAYNVRYAQEARGYSLMVLLTLLSFYFFVKLVKGGSSRYTSVGYVVCTALLIYAHFYGVFFVAAQVLYLLVSRENLRRWILPGVALALLYVPWVLLLAVNVLSPAGAWRGGTTWIPEPTLADSIRIFHAYSGSQPLAIVFILLAGYGLFRIVRGDKPTAYLLLAWLLVPIVVPFIVSHLYRPMLVDRYTIAASPAFYLLVTQGIAGFKGFVYAERRYVQALLVVLAATLSVVSITGYFGAVTKQPWREVAGYLDTYGRAGDLALLYGGALPFDHYSENTDVDIEAFVASKNNAGMRKKVSTMVAGRDRVWLAVFWETGRARDVLPEQLRRLYGEPTFKEIYAINDTYNSEVATFPYQGDGIELLFFEGPEKDQGELS